MPRDYRGRVPSAAGTPTNLAIRPDSLVDRVVFDGTTAVGVRLADGTVIDAGRVILSAGVYGSPAILLRSGIGTAENWSTCREWARTSSTTRRCTSTAATQAPPAGATPAGDRDLA